MEDKFAQTFMHGKKIGDYDDELEVEDWAGKKTFVTKTVDKLLQDKNVKAVIKSPKSALLVDLSGMPRFFRVVSAGTSDFSIYERDDVETAKSWLVKAGMYCDFQYGCHILVKDKEVMSKDKHYKTKTFSTKKAEKAKPVGFNSRRLNTYLDEGDKNRIDVCPVCHMEKINGTCDCN